MENFVFSSRAKTTTLAFLGIGVLCLALSFFADGGEAHHMRFWSNFLHNTVFFLGIAFISGFALAAFTTAYAGWFVQFKRVWESTSTFLLPALFLMGVLIVGLWTHGHHLYHWNDEAAVAGDAILTHKQGFLNKYWYTFGTIAFVGLWYFFLGRMRNISIDEDTAGDDSYSHYRSYKKYAAIFLPIAGFTSAAMIWQWIMSLDSHWYSTMFAWYASASWFVAMTAFTIMLLIYLKSRGYFAGVNQEHFHDLGKYLFAISIFWTYLWFSQFMLIWYGNVGEETIYFRERMDNYPFLFWANLALNFVLPFFVLMRNDTKRKAGTLFFASALIFFGHWLDFFQMIKPAARLTVIELNEGHGHGEGHDDHATMGAHDGEHHGDDHAHDVDEHLNDDVEGAGPQIVSESARGESPRPTVDGDHDGTATADTNIPVARENEEGPETASFNREDQLATDSEQDEEDNFEANAYVQERYIDDVEMQGTLEVAGGHSEEDHTLGFKSGYTLPGLLEIGTFLGFLGGFLFWVLSRLETARIVPINDPYMEESIHHHT